MATFKWDITDASDELTPAHDGGTVNIADVPSVKGNGWQVSPPDGDLAHQPLYGGALEAEAPAQKVNKAAADGTPGSLNADGKFNQMVIVTILVVLGVGFLAVVASGVFRGTLTFQTFTSFILALLASIGVGGAVGRWTSRAGDGDG